MVKKVFVEGFEEYNKAVEDNKGKQIFAIFSGSKDSNGASWCPDCVQADPVVNKYVESLPDTAVFIYCGVGNRTFWKDQSNVFRKKLMVRSVPTLVKVGTRQKLEEAQCANPSLVEMFFQDE